MTVVSANSGELGGRTMENTLPQITRVCQHIGLVHQGDLVARPDGRAAEGIPGKAANAERGVDVLLHRDLVRGALAEDPTDLDISAFSPLPDHQDVQDSVA